MNLSETERIARQYRRNVQTMRRQLRQLKQSTGPRYVVWYWLQGGRNGAVSMCVHCQTDDLSEAQQQRELAGAQPCCGGCNNVFIFDRWQIDNPDPSKTDRHVQTKSNQQ